MADTTYNVRVKYDVDKTKAESDANALSKTFDRVAAAWGAAFSVHKMLDFSRRVVELNAGLERMQISLAATLTGFGAEGFSRGGKDFEKAMHASALLMDRIRIASAQVASDADDMTMIFQALMPGAIKAGKPMLGGNDSVLEMAKLFSALPGINARLAKAGPQVIARELQMLMEGNARSTLDIYGPLRAFLGSPKEFNKLNDEEKWTRLSKAIHQLITPEHLDRVSKTWGAISSTAVTWAQQIIRLATGPAFELLKSHLKGINDWFIKNRQSAEDWARSVGSEIGNKAGGYFSAIESAVKFVIENRDAIIDVVKAAGVAASAFTVMSKVGSAGNFVTNINTVTSKLNALAIAAGLAAGALELIAEWWNKHHENDVKNIIPESEQLKRLVGMATGSGSAVSLNGDAYAIAQRIVRDNQLAGDDGVVNPRTLANYLKTKTSFTDITGMSDESIRGTPIYRIFETAAQAMLDQGKSLKPLAMPRVKDPMEDVLSRSKKAAPEKPNVNVSLVIRQDISDAGDPERILVKTKQAIEDALIRPIESGSSRFSVRR